MVKKGETIKIIKKLDEYSDEYEIGDTFLVEGTWYGGIHITGKTGIPVSLETEEFEPLRVETRDGIEKNLAVNVKKVIFHVDEVEKVVLAFCNIQNMIEYYEERNEKLIVELLLNGEGVQALLSKEKVEILIQLKKKQVIVAVCKNSLLKHKLVEEEYAQKFTIVPVGVVELSEKQWEGYAYIRP